MLCDIHELIAAFTENWKACLTALVFGLTLGGSVATLYQSAAKEVLTERLGQAQDIDHEQAGRLADRQAEIEAFRNQLTQASAERDASATKITQLQGEIASLKAGASAGPKPLPDDVARLTQRNTQLQRQLDQLQHVSRTTTPLSAPTETATLTDQSIQILLAIYKKVSTTAELATALGIDEGRIQYNLDKLAQAGFISDKPDPSRSGIRHIAGYNWTTAKGRAYVIEHGLDKGQ